MDEQPQSPASIRSVPALTVLDRAFLSADDAARYAHERVGRRRDREYYGYILQRNDQRFFITEPSEQSNSSSTHHDRVPDNHVLHSRFYSHPALSTLDARKVADLEWSIDDAATSLLMFSVKELRNILASNLPAYLSGSEDSLIGFTADSSRWLTRLKQIGTAEAPGKLALDLEKGTVKPEQLVVEAAAAGDLQVIVSNGRWRPRGKVTAEIVPGPWERSVPERVSFGAVFKSADEAALDRYSRDTGQHDEEQTWFGFILKQKGKQEYIASELVPVSGVRDKLYSLRSLFGISPTTREHLYPESFIPHSYFYSRQRVKHARDAPRRWLAQHFIVPRDLWVVVYNSKRRPVIETNASIPLYVATQDGALLRYVARKGTRLFDNDVPNMGLDVIQKNLASGKLTTTDFVRVVANSGVLQVMRTSLCWDRKGLVDTYWTPSVYLERRALGPVFPTADDAAVHARSQVPEGNARAFGGLILKRTDGFFVATDPVDIPQEDFDIKWIFPDEAVTTGQFPAGCNIVARYRSRGPRALPVVLSTVDKELYLNMLSVDVVYTAFTRKEQPLDEYLFAPDGSIIRYRVGVWERIRADLAVALSASGKPGRDLDAAWIKDQIYQGLLSPTDWVKKLAKSGYLQVVLGSRLWGRARAVTEFVPFTRSIRTNAARNAVSEPAYSPVHIREQDAARFAHEQAGSRAALSFGFLLMHSRNGYYVATLPIEALNSSFSYGRVFPDTLPYRYVTSGIFLCATKAPSGLTDDDYRHFFSPIDVSLARAVVRTNHGYQPIYFSCADGALLRFKLHAFDPANTLDKFGQVELKDNPFATPAQAQHDWNGISQGRFSLTGYIRNMTAFGQLEVLVTSPYWSCPGTVGQDWSPRMPAVSDEELWANKPVFPLGPVFHHPDDAARHTQLRAARVGGQSVSLASAVLSKPTTHSYVGLEPVVDSPSSYKAHNRIFRTASDPSTTPRNKAPLFPDGYALTAGYELSRSTTIPAVPQEVNYATAGSVYAYTHVLTAKGFNIEAFYYSTRHGALLKYVPAHTQEEARFLLTGQLLSSEDFVYRLANVSVLKVLKTAADWNQPGRLGQDWKITRQQVPDVFDRPTRDEL
ncbi:DUF4329 domain-containing protein [Pseudomonas sp. ANT_J28]|uniref:DUF4329 domain-containing protein n=1 Tax=Pseudomonas sp. ANT_J28 TaxID=2597352 RepID=UPI0011F150D1|nr:DUF4329 domain-containing protein [Pseudomonas sp. ANT_J28]KAA0982409.1 hypothetical protein FQ187_15720 [Pseudomonas sp. ANT_J28]